MGTRGGVKMYSYESMITFDCIPGTVTSCKTEEKSRDLHRDRERERERGRDGDTERGRDGERERGRGSVVIVVHV